MQWDFYKNPQQRPLDSEREVNGSLVNHFFDLSAVILRRLNRNLRKKKSCFRGCRAYPPAMASLTSSSRRSSSSYRSSSRYSTSSSYRSEGSLGGSSDSLDPLFEPFLDSADHSGLFGEESTGGPGCLAPFSRHSRSSYGHSGKGSITVAMWWIHHSKSSVFFKELVLYFTGKLIYLSGVNLACESLA